MWCTLAMDVRLAVAPGKWLSENECLKVHILIEHEVFCFRSAFCMFFHLILLLLNGTRKCIYALERNFFDLFCWRQCTRYTQMKNKRWTAAGKTGQTIFELIKNIQKAILKFFNTQRSKHGKTNWFLHWFSSFSSSLLAGWSTKLLLLRFLALTLVFPHQFLFFMFLSFDFWKSLNEIIKSYSYTRSRAGSSATAAT